MIPDASLQLSSFSGGNPVSEGSHFVVLLLRPFVEGVVVALRAHHLGAEEELGGVGHVVQFHAGIPEVVTGGSVLPGIALGGDQRVGDLIERLVLPDLFLYPMVVELAGPDLGSSAHPRLEPEQVRPPVEHLALVGGGKKQGVNQHGPLATIAVRKVGTCLVIGGNPSRNSQVEPAGKPCLVQVPGDFRFHLPMGLLENTVDGRGLLSHLLGREGEWTGICNHGNREQGYKSGNDRKIPHCCLVILAPMEKVALKISVPVGF